LSRSATLIDRILALLQQLALIVREVAGALNT
jgi:hypothetical protein